MEWGQEGSAVGLLINYRGSCTATYKAPGAYLGKCLADYHTCSQSEDLSQGWVKVYTLGRAVQPHCLRATKGYAHLAFMETTQGEVPG